jgi:NAD(P)-dependent dehydrogenase (short-subunit alcohol dehydrogenase family)
MREALIMRLSNKSAIVTGGARGIGRGIAMQFARNGADISVVDILEKEIQETVKEVRSMGRKAIGISTDVSKDDQVGEMVKRTLAEFQKIDVLVNCAGIIRYGEVIGLSEADWDATMGVNAKGVFLCCRAVAPHMIRQKYGKIINIASRAGKTGETKISPYCASKAAVILLTQSLALELAPYHINVNSICPGLISTDMIKSYFEDDARRKGISYEEVRDKASASIPLGRLGEPEDVGKLAVFLASGDSDYITGQDYNIGGGLALH